MDLYGIFYNPTKLLSYGRVLNFSIGSRSIGKSTGFAIMMLKDYIEKGRQFIYVRRTKDELLETAPSYFDNAVDILKSKGIDIQDFYYKGGKYYLNGEICGYALPLSLQQKYKSSNYSLVWWILYDEFMLTPGTNSTYIGGNGGSLAEVDAMTSLYQTVDRGVGKAFRNECKIIFVGNAGTFFNPFFINYKIDRYLRPDSKYIAPKNDIYVCEFTRETEATKYIKESYGYLMSTEKTKAYAYNNKCADLKGDEFITKKPEGRHISLCNFVYNGEKYGLYSYPEAGYLYVSHKEAVGRMNIALTTGDHRPNYLMIKTWSNNPTTKLLKEMYNIGDIRFYDYKCKLAVDFYLSYDV